MAVKKIDHEALYAIFLSEDKAIYKKKGRFLYRKAVEGETVLTIVAGKLETLKTAKEGNIVLRNINLGGSAETYIVDEMKFKNRYKPSTKRYQIEGTFWFEAFAEGQIEAFEYLDPDPILFKAPWGEDMVCYFGDFIGRPVGGDEHDIYRVERETFMQTYGE